MSAGQLISEWAAAGVVLEWRDGRVKVIGKPATVEPLLPAIRAHKAALEAHLAPPVPEEIIALATELIQRVRQPHHHVAAPWRMAAREYYQHHAQCQQCQGAGQGRGHRCDAGLDLWQAYQAAGSDVSA